MECSLTFPQRKSHATSFQKHRSAAWPIRIVSARSLLGSPPGPGSNTSSLSLSSSTQSCWPLPTIRRDCNRRTSLNGHQPRRRSTLSSHASLLLSSSWKSSLWVSSCRKVATCGMHGTASISSSFRSASLACCRLEGATTVWRPWEHSVFCDLYARSIKCRRWEIRFSLLWPPFPALCESFSSSSSFSPSSPSLAPTSSWASSTSSAARNSSLLKTPMATTIAGPKPVKTPVI